MRNPSGDRATRSDSIMYLRNGGVALLIDIDPNGMPEVLHWGADLGPLDDAALADVVAALERPRPNNTLEIPLRVSVVPEPHAGWLGRPGLAGAREGGDDWSPLFRPERITRQQLADGTVTVTVVAGDEPGGLRLEIDLELAPSGLARMRARLTNARDAPYAVEELSVVAPTPLRASEVLDFAGRWAKERHPQRGTLNVGTHLRENRRGRTGADAAHLMCVGEPGFGFQTGEIWATHVAFSGNHRSFADRVTAGVQVLGGGELLLPGEVRLARDESYETPWVYLAYGVGLDAVAHRFHRWLRARPHHPSAERPVTLNVWEAVYFDHTLSRLVDLADRAHAVGVERFVLDDGWFTNRRDDTAGLGDWVVDERVWPEGLAPLVDRVGQHGMQFGLWFEPEMVNPDSDLARRHPEWIMGTSGRLPVLSRHQLVLDLTIADAYAHVRDSIAALVARYGIRYLKWDHNRDLTDAGHPASGRAAVSAQTRAVSRLMDELRTRFPGLEIESCSSGGARVDLAILEHTDRVWASDCIDPLERQEIDSWTAQLIPPELIGSHIGAPRSHTTGRTHPLAFRAATAMFGHLGIEWDISSISDDERHALGEWIALYRRHRSLLFGGDVMRSADGDDSIRVRGVVSPTRDEALYCLATVSASPYAPRTRVRFPGLEAARRYRVAVVGEPLPEQWTGDAAWVDGVTLPGSVLGVVGLPIPEMQPEQAFVVHLAAAD